MLQYTVFNLFKSEVVLIKDFTGALQIKVVFCINVPWKLNKGLDVIHLDRIFTSGGIKPLEFIQLLLEGKSDFFTPFLLLALFYKIKNLLILGRATQLILYGFHLLV